MTLDEAIQQITEQLKKQRIEKTRKSIFIAVVVGLSFSILLGYIVWMTVNENIAMGIPFHLAIRIPFLLGFFLFSAIGGLGFVIVRNYVKDLKNNELRILGGLQGNYLSHHRDTVLFDYGFYELALDGFDKELNDLHKKTEKRDEILNRFLEDYFDIYKKQSRFVNGIPRPVPAFSNDNLYQFQSIIEWRQRCLLKLGREKESEAENEKLQTIKNILEENRQFTEKYWKDFAEHYDEYYSYDD